MKRARMVIPILVAGTLVAAVSERAETPNPASVAQPPDTEIRECPQAHDSTGGAEILTSGSSGIPEFNDCQRFIVAGKFDSLYAIYVPPKLRKPQSGCASRGHTELWRDV